MTATIHVIQHTLQGDCRRDAQNGLWGHNGIVARHRRHVEQGDGSELIGTTVIGERRDGSRLSRRAEQTRAEQDPQHHLRAAPLLDGTHVPIFRSVGDPVEGNRTS